MKSKFNKIMVIDDDEIDQRSYRRVLNRADFAQDVLSFTYAEEALDYLVKHPEQIIDAIFLDINMPRMNGIEFLEAATSQLGDKFTNLVVIMLTAPLTEPDRLKVETYVCVGKFLEKPLTVELALEVAQMSQIIGSRIVGMKEITHMDPAWAH